MFVRLSGLYGNRMWRNDKAGDTDFLMAISLRASLAVAAVLCPLVGCGPLDNNAWLASRYRESAEFLFQPPATVRQPDAPPDVKALIRDNVSSVFLGSNASNIQVGAPRRNGYGWIACVKAEITGVSKRDIGTQIFVIEMNDGRIGLRRRATTDDRCDSAPFEPV